MHNTIYTPYICHQVSEAFYEFMNHAFPHNEEMHDCLVMIHNEGIMHSLVMKPRMHPHVKSINQSIDG